MENIKQYHDDQEPSSSKKPKLDASESISKQQAKEINIFSDDAAVLNKEKNVQIITKRKLSVVDADAPPKKREKPSDIGSTDKGHGLKNTLHGITYKLKLLMLILVQAAKEMKINEEFKCFISTEDPKCGVFGDIVFRFTNGDQWFLLCIQAKHQEDDTKSITWNDFIATSTDPYSISKYFNSYLQQKTDETEKTNSPAPTLILCTNIGLEQEVKDVMVDAKQSFEGTLVGSFFESLKSDIHTFDLDKITKKDDGKLLASLTENSDFEQLPKQLAGLIFKRETVDFRNPLFKKHRGFIQNKIATNDCLTQEIKNIYKINEDFFDNCENEEFKKNFETEYRKLIKQETKKSTIHEPKIQDIWPDVQCKGIRVNKVTITNETVLPKKIEQTAVEMFCNSFVIAANTLNELELSALIVNELKKYTDTQETIASKIARDQLSQWILEWMKNEKSKPLNEQDIKEFFEYFAVSLKFLHIEGMSKDYCRTIQNLKLECKTEILKERRLYKKLDRWLSEPGIGGHKVDILRSNDPSWVVHDTLELYKSNLVYLFFEDGQFEKSKRDIMKVFIDMTLPLILVIECKRLSNIKWYIAGRVEGIPTKTIKKIILIDQTDNAAEIEKDLLVRDLTDECKEQVIKQTKRFFGTETSTSVLFHDEDKLNFVLDVLQLSSGTGIKCNKLKEKYEEIKEIFIHRKWERCDEKELRETHILNFWSARNEGTTLTKLFPGVDAENKISYKTFLGYSNLDTEKFNRIILRGNSEYTLPPGVDGKTQEQLQSKKPDSKVHVICNEAGSGKSYYLTWLASYLQDVDLSWWIIKFNLNQYSMLFDQLQKNYEIEIMDELITIKFLFQLVYLAWFVDNIFRMDTNENFNNVQAIAEALDFSNGCLKLDENKTKSLSSEELILLRIFVHKYNSKQIIILMDGFDEIAPYYKTVVLKLLSTLKTFDGICKLYLSSRPYGLRNEVETALEDCACYRLVEFDQQDQYSFIDRYLSKHFDEYKSSDDTKQAMTCRVVFAILREILGDLMEIPLFLSMGIELLMPMVKKYINVEEKTISKQIIKHCENSFEPLSMVESFVEKKLNIVNIEKTGSTIAIAKTVKAMNDAEQYLKTVKETHSLLAMYTIMSGDDIKKLLTVETRNTALRYMENVKNGSEKLGLIEGVVDNTPIFNHKLFAEFFAALWFYKNQNTTGVKDFLKREIYETKRRKEIRQFLDRMVCGKSPLHMAILDGSKGEMERILTEKPNFITAIDDWGRTPLQLSFLLSPCESHRKIVKFLLHWVDENHVNIQDSYFEWFPLDYAYCADIVIPCSNRESYDGSDWHCLMTLLNKGASIDTPEMLSRFSTKEHFLMMIADVLIIELCRERYYTPHFETFFTKLVKNFGSNKVFNLKIPIHASSRGFCREEMRDKFFIKQNQHIRKIYKDLTGSIPILEFCIMIDSVMSKIIIENSNDFKLQRFNKYYYKLALKCRSVNVLQYLITDHPQYLKVIKDKFERKLWELLAYLQYDEQKFKSLFHEYCTRHNIACREDTPLQSEKWNRGFSSQHDLMKKFPTKFEIRADTGVDSGTEFLIARALHLDNASAVEYLLHKSNTNLDNRLIRQICLNCEIKWCCQSSYHFLLTKCIDRTGTDERGRNLLQFAVGYGDSNLVKCLIEHYAFQPTKINTRENNWNAFFYCASSCGRYYNNIWDDDDDDNDDDDDDDDDDNDDDDDDEDDDNDDNNIWDNNIENIFVHMLEKDPVDCFSQLDTKGKSVFYYAVKNNKKISDYIIRRKFAMQLEDLSSHQITDLINLLNASGLNAKEMLEYLQYPHLDNESKCKSICDSLESIGKLRYYDKNGRNLLHIAMTNKWFILGKCLIEHYGFNVKEINEKENNWNAFFYCVISSKNASNILEIFTYLMEKDPFDCFGQLDSEGKSVFLYATVNNDENGKDIFKQECKLLEYLPIEERVPVLMDKLKNSNLNGYDKILQFEQNNLVDEKSVKIICDYFKKTGQLDYREEETDRNLLHIACFEGWLTLAKCLIEHYSFDAKEINEKENNWNAFFYCVCNSENASKKLDIFTYLMEKDSFDCFGQLDSEGKSVFWYATDNNKEIGKDIFKRECKLQEHLPIAERVPVLMDKLKKSNLNGYDKILQFEQNNLFDEKSVKIVCDYLKTTGQLDYREKETDRNLLHIACTEGWLTLAECLVEHYGFDAKEINEKENNWNAFFYCVCYSENASKKLDIFTYLMEKDSFDCFGQLDSEGKSVFWYAMDNNDEITKNIFKRKFKMQEHLSIKERIPFLMGLLQNFSPKAYDILCQNGKNHLIDEKIVSMICDSLEKTEEIHYREEETDRNLLHIACTEGWLTLAKCLIEHYGFDAKEINEKENNWNAFFYCVCYSEKTSTKLEIFTYLIENDPLDCFDQLDSEGKSVFWYATDNNKEVGEDIFKRECKLQEHLPIEERVPVLMDKLKNSSLNSYGKILQFVLNNLVDENSVKIICDHLNTTGQLDYRENETGRNLLHIACFEGWLTLAKCLIEHYGFDAKEMNEKEKKWNAFFYCVCTSENASNKPEIFTYLMEKDSFDCFGQLDSEGKSVFWYAIDNEKIQKDIFKRECELQEHLPFEERIPVLMDKLNNSCLNSNDEILKIEQNNLVDEKSVNIICDYLNTTGQLNYKNEETGRNLLHIACIEGWSTLAKCLIEHYDFDVKEINEKENKWNAFFYCVCNSEYISKKMEIFSYMMKKESYDYEALQKRKDFKGKRIFYYAAKNNSKICDYIIQTTFSEQLNYFNNDKIDRFVKFLEHSGFDTKEMLKYLQGTPLCYASACKTICDTLQSMGELTYTDDRNRNLLHLAIIEGWITLTKCLIEYYSYFVVMQPNDKENNWNAFFYCVCNSENASNKLEIFTYLMKKNHFDCYDANNSDLMGKTVFYYATKNNSEIGRMIFNQKCESLKRSTIQARSLSLTKCLQDSKLNIIETLRYFELHQLVDEKSIGTIFDYLSLEEGREYKDKETGRNILQIAIVEGWLALTKCLIEFYSFDTEEINQNEHNWDSFFYCVFNKEKVKEKQEIFTYMMISKDINCFDKVDLEGKSVFYYATLNNEEITNDIFNRERKKLEHFPTADRFAKLFKILTKSPLNAFGKIALLERNHLIDETSVKIICNYLEENKELSYRSEETGRNLLHIAVKEGWLTVTKCLIEHHSFKAEEINEREKNWNAFFYCVYYSKQKENRIKIFTYMIEKTNIDCFAQIDSDGRNIFFYATLMNEEIANKIFKQSFNNHCKHPERVPYLIKQLADSKLNIVGMLRFFEQNNLIDKTSVELICDYHKDKFNYKDNETGRNLLQIAIIEGWISLAKCLIEHNHVSSKESNENENNWNAFFYCVCNSENASNKHQIFRYMMSNDPMDCFIQLDSRDISVFSYAMTNNKNIGHEILKYEYKLQNNLPKTILTTNLMLKLENTALTVIRKLQCFEKLNLFYENSIQVICDRFKQTGELAYEEGESGRNLLHIAIMKGWFTLTVYLIERCGFDTKKINERENNWNAFFYCVCNKINASYKLKIFKYMTVKYSMNFFEQVDTKGKSVFYYAVQNNLSISNYIIQREFSTELINFNIRQVKSLIKGLTRSGFDTIDLLTYLQDTHLRCAMSCVTIGNALSVDELHYMDEINRNLLHIAIEKGWFVFGKCLIEHFEFNVKQVNEKDNNWNAFFYCVSENTFGPLEERVNFFNYMMKKDAMDCFQVLDSDGHCVFSYAVMYNENIAHEIFKRERDLLGNLPKEELCRTLIEKLKNTILTVRGMVVYFELHHLFDEKSIEAICANLEKIGELHYQDDETGRNLLHIAILEGWFVLIKCLVEIHEFDVLEINPTETNWNAFFYCVCNKERTIERVNIFDYLISLTKDMDFFNRLDTMGNNVFFYATLNNQQIADKIFKEECKLQEYLPIEERIPLLMSKLKKSELNACENLLLLTQNHLIDDSSVRIICDYMKTTGELSYTDEETGRDLLHIACMEGWLTLAKCLIEHYGFSAKKVNEKDDKSNAFFYCVSNRENAANKLQIFNYLMKKDPLDCLGQLDSKGKSFFWYATNNNDEIRKDIFKRECELQEHLPVEMRIPKLMEKLKIPSLNSNYEILEVEHNHLVDEKLVKIICDYMKTTGELNYKNEETGRDLLHIACMEGWLTLAKCLIEHYGFDAKEINEKEDNRNAFFYCVCNSENASNKLKIFTYLMEKYPFDCFGQLDSKGKSVFWDATVYNDEISDDIFKRECKLQEHLPIEERVPLLMDKLNNSCLNSYDKILQFEHNHLVDENSVKIICDYMKTTGELDYREETGRDLLHIACMEGSLSLAKYLIEHCGFDMNKINVKENNWNAFFYCVCNSENAANKVKIFSYLMENDPFDCFGQLDSKGKSVFWYARVYSDKINEDIFKRECKLQEHLPIEERIHVLMDKLKNSNLNGYDKILQFYQNNLVDEKSVKIICDCLTLTEELNRKSDETGRNLLQNACMKGWLTLAKCLIEHYGFDAKEINEKEKNWNAFFYCVCNTENVSNKLKIFTYLMEKDPFDCFGQLDSENHYVFYHALLKNVLVADYIIRNELPANNSVPVKEWASIFSKLLSESKLTRTNVNRFLTDWKQSSTLDAKHEIYVEIKSNLKRMN